jgi:hypothetical protein
MERPWPRQGLHLRLGVPSLWWPHLQGLWPWFLLAGFPVPLMESACSAFNLPTISIFIMQFTVLRSMVGFLQK